MRTISLPTLKESDRPRERAIDEEVIFVGHSVGGSVLLSYLAVARTRSLSGRSPPIVAGNAGFERRLHGREESSGPLLALLVPCWARDQCSNKPGFVLAPLLWGK